jgi:pre-mRNA cleavage complex 2 protein Pcf11
MHLLTLRQTSREKKLPAFYVLDSIVKNVGTPYTLFFGRQLYSTFMAAYALVDQPVRRKMDEMLKTWKEPVPGSMDTRPVFPPEVTRPIENALIRAKTSYLQESRSQPNAYQQPSGHMSQQPFNQHYQQPAHMSQQTTNQQYQQPPQISQQTTNQHYQPPAQMPQQTTNQHYQPPAHMSQQPTSQQSTENMLDPVTLNTIMATLIARGVLPAVPASVQTPLQPITSIPPGFPPPLLSTPPPIPQYISTPPSQARTPLAEIPNDVVLKPASLKM